jgi:hypothetical protein
MWSAVFVETTTPASVLFGEINRDQGAFDEPTVFKQRSLRWDFFRLCYTFSYLCTSWKLARWELATKIWVFH